LARELIVAWAGRHRRDRWDELCSDYREKIGRSWKIRELAVKSRDPEIRASGCAPRAKGLCVARPSPLAGGARSAREAVSSSEWRRVWLRWREECRTPSPS
jgi:hypothetical protein